MSHDNKNESFFLRNYIKQVMLKRCLWYGVLTARYGEEAETIGDGERLASVWWSSLLSITRDSNEGVGCWFTDHLRREVRDEVGTLFWWDPWLEGGILKDRFNRLFFYLLYNKLATVTYMFSLGWRRDVRRGNGDGGCCLVRKNCGVNVMHFYYQLFCGLM